jgi:hypothetical protein
VCKREKLSSRVGNLNASREKAYAFIALKDGNRFSALRMEGRKDGKMGNRRAVILIINLQYEQLSEISGDVF